jgi:hypothetical protein
MRTITTWLTPLTAAALFFGALSPSAGAADALRPAAAGILTQPHQSIEQLGERMRPNEAKWRRQWAVSLAPLFVSQSLDSASSYGMRELNPLLASPNGGFGMKAASIKFGVVGGLVGVEYLLVKKYPRSAKFFTIVNWTTAGATTGLAIHNYRLH